MAVRESAGRSAGTVNWTATRTAVSAAR